MWFCIVYVEVIVDCNIACIVKPVLRGHLWDKEKVAFQDRWPLKRDLIDMKFSTTRQEKDDLLIQVAA